MTPKKKTRAEWLARAQRAIDRRATVVYDMAADCGQIVDNVKRMRWFVRAVAEELAGDRWPAGRIDR